MLAPVWRLTYICRLQMVKESLHQVNNELILQDLVFDHLGHLSVLLLFFDVLEHKSQQLEF